MPYHTICSRVLRKKSHKKTKKTLHISLRNALLAIINNISVFAKLWTIFTEILEHQYFETITLHRSVTRQAWINVFLTRYTTSLCRSPTLSWYSNFFFSSCFFCLILKVEFNLPKQRNQWHFIFKTESLCSCLCFLNDHTLLWRKKVIFLSFFFLLALVCVC